MKYINKKLSIEKIKVEDIAKKFGTPTYCYSYKRLKDNIKNFKNNWVNPWLYQDFLLSLLSNKR